MRPIEPATMTWEEAAQYAFRRSGAWLRRHIDTDPRCAGFPRPHPALGLFLREQIDRWLRAQFGEGQTRDYESILMERIGRSDGTAENPISGRETKPQRRRSVLLATEN